MYQIAHRATAPNIKRAMVRPRAYQAYGRRHIDSIPELSGLSSNEKLAMKAVSAVLPFRVNRYVLEELIRWDDIPNDPMYQLTFPQPGMLSSQDLDKMMELVRRDAPEQVIRQTARQIQRGLNPHPGGQMQLNVPLRKNQPLSGMQHKYRETVLFFPTQGQTCHAYCTYCFRWAQFVGLDDLKFASREVRHLVGYLIKHKEASSVLFTGGDPLIMRTAVLRRYIEPLLAPELEHITTIRLGTKSTAYWPYRFVTDSDADDLLRLFEEVRRAGKHLALMAHNSLPRELETPVAQLAISRIRSSGAVVRCQAPLCRHVNDDAQLWADMWRLQVQLGAVPYYMFIERDTGPKNYFETPLARAHEIFSSAYQRVSGLARTVRGPSMSATPGKVVVDGVTEVAGKRVFALRFLQGRNPDWVGRPFFAEYDARATWLTQLRPAFGEKRFFFEEELDQIKQTSQAPAWNGKPVARRRPSIFSHVE